MLTEALDKNIILIKEIFNNDDTLRLREFQNALFPQLKCALFYIDNMSDSDRMNRHILQPIMRSAAFGIDKNNFDTIRDQVLSVDFLEESEDMKDIIAGITIGDSVLLIDGYPKAFIISTKSWAIRSVDEPQNEMILTGPREGFVESLMTNLTLIRRKLQTSDLKFTMVNLGDNPSNAACIAYLENQADQSVLKELKKRLKKYQFNGTLDTNYIQEAIRDHPYSLFKTTGTTERPDSVAGKLLEGRIAVFVEGSPVVLTLPYFFAENFQSMEDYSLSFYFASIGRFLRIMSFVVSIILPALYVAIITYHQELLPTPFMLSITKSRDGVPFPSVAEVLLLLLAFEVLRETGSRMPSNFGQAFSIVGAIVLGQAAIDAKFVSSAVVIVVALSAICSLMIPRFKVSTMYCRLFVIMGATVFGFLGLLICSTVIGMYICSLTSFGKVYVSGFNPFTKSSYSDIFIRSSWKKKADKNE